MTARGKVGGTFQTKLTATQSQLFFNTRAKAQDQGTNYNSVTFIPSINLLERNSCSTFEQNVQEFSHEMKKLSSLKSQLLSKQRLSAAAKQNNLKQIQNIVLMQKQRKI